MPLQELIMHPILKESDQQCIESIPALNIEPKKDNEYILTEGLTTDKDTYNVDVGYKDGTFDEIEVPKNLGEIMAKHKAKKKPAKKQMPHKEEERMEEKVHPGIHKKIDEIEKKKGK